MEQIGQENFCQILNLKLWKQWRKDWCLHIRGGEKGSKSTLKNCTAALTSGLFHFTALWIPVSPLNSQEYPIKSRPDPQLI